MPSTLAPSTGLHTHATAGVIAGNDCDSTPIAGGGGMVTEVKDESGRDQGDLFTKPSNSWKILARERMCRTCVLYGAVIVITTEKVPYQKLMHARSETEPNEMMALK